MCLFVATCGSGMDASRLSLRVARCKRIRHRRPSGCKTGGCLAPIKRRTVLADTAVASANSCRVLAQCRVCVFSPKTARLKGTLACIAFAFGGEAGSRLAFRLGTLYAASARLLAKRRPEKGNHHFKNAHLPLHDSTNTRNRAYCGRSVRQIICSSFASSTELPGRAHCRTQDRWLDLGQTILVTGCKTRSGPAGPK